MKILSLFLSFVLASPVVFAGDRDHRSYSNYNSHKSYKSYPQSYHGYSDSGRRYGYYHNSRGDLVFGLLAIGTTAAIIASIERPVYVERVVVTQPPVVYVQPAPIVEITQTTINVQNSNGSFTPVTLNKVNGRWVGPRGEYYDTLPTIGQLRPVYGF
jgi:hypothetical protein